MHIQYTCCILYIINTIIHYYTLLYTINCIYIYNTIIHNMASKSWYDFEPHCHFAPTVPVWMAWPCPLRVSWGAAGAWSRGSHPNSGIEYVWSVCYIGRCLGGSPQLHHFLFIVCLECWCELKRQPWGNCLTNDGDLTNDKDVSDECIFMLFVGWVLIRELCGFSYYHLVI